LEAERDPGREQRLLAAPTRRQVAEHGHQRGEERDPGESLAQVEESGRQEDERTEQQGQRDREDHRGRVALGDPGRRILGRAHPRGVHARDRGPTVRHVVARAFSALVWYFDGHLTRSWSASKWSPA